MPPPLPSLLVENAGLAFLGEKPWQPAAVTPRRAQSIEQTRNPTGRPNSDVLRRYVGFKSGHIQEHNQVDFPSHSTEQEAGLYQEPCRQLRSQLTDFSGSWWLNPHAQPALRTAIARLERYLATPLSVKELAWDWIDSMLLPDDSLLVVARDDDFTQGLLCSQAFQLWRSKYAAHLSTAEIVAAFPFPWPPATLFSSLTREQEEHRMTITRAARGSDQEQIDSGVAAAYGWPSGQTENEALARLEELNRRRAR